jgi:hypothetical protein
MHIFLRNHNRKSAPFDRIVARRIDVHANPVFRRSADACLFNLPFDKINNRVTPTGERIF